MKERVEVWRGDIRHFRGQWCEACDGGGGFGRHRDGSLIEKCEQCDGTGELFSSDCRCSKCDDLAEVYDQAMTMTTGAIP